jgi:hypothetical protein
MVTSGALLQYRKVGMKQGPIDFSPGSWQRSALSNVRLDIDSAVPSTLRSPTTRPASTIAQMPQVLRERDAMICRFCSNEERASEGYPCEDCGTFICIICTFRGVVHCKKCEEQRADARNQRSA